MFIKHELRKFTNVVFEKLNVPQIPPRVPLFFIEVTNNCNLNCDFCPRKDLSRGTGYMDFDLFKIAIRKIKDAGARWVNLNRFGESLVHPQFFEMLNYAKKEGIPNIGLISNGQLLTEEVTEKLLNAGLDRLNISLDTLDRTKYEKARRGASLDLVLNNLDYLIKYRDKMGNGKPKIGLFSVLVTEEFEQMQKLFEKFAHRVNYIEFRPIASYGSSQQLKNLPHIEATKGSRMVCIQPWQRLNIFYNGDVNPCCGDVDGELVIGNIKEHSFKELWYGENIQRIRKLLTKRRLEDLPVCLSCAGTDATWYQEALTQLRDIYKKLDPDIEVVKLVNTTPILYRHSTKKLWR